MVDVSLNNHAGLQSWRLEYESDVKMSQILEKIDSFKFKCSDTKEAEAEADVTMWESKN